ncbi:MAG: RNA polymerase sigma factor [Nitrospirae bacterium]|nr:MAG: RNA polymerase sigma factor [Nitrospirota bacterium]
MDRFLAGVERRAFRMAQLAVRNRDDALDIVQEAMAVLVQRYREREASEWGPLFYRILQSRVADWHRRQWVRTRWRTWFAGSQDDDLSSREESWEQLPDVGMPDPSEALAQRRAAAAIECALRELPLRQRQAFLLRAWEGYDVARTAQAMGCSEGSVKTHYSRAVQALRKRLADHV